MLCQSQNIAFKIPLYLLLVLMSIRLYLSITSQIPSDQGPMALRMLKMVTQQE